MSYSAPFLPVTPSLSADTSFAQAAARPRGQPVGWGLSSPPLVRNIFDFSRLENVIRFGSTSDRFCNSPTIILRHHFWKLPSPWPFLVPGRQCVYETPGPCSHVSLCSSLRACSLHPLRSACSVGTFRVLGLHTLGALVALQCLQKTPFVFRLPFPLFSGGGWPSTGQSESQKQKF